MFEFSNTIETGKLPCLFALQMTTSILTPNFTQKILVNKSILFQYTLKIYLRGVKVKWGRLNVQNVCWRHTKITVKTVISPVCDKQKLFLTFPFLLTSPVKTRNFLSEKNDLGKTLASGKSGTVDFSCAENRENLYSKWA